MTAPKPARTAPGEPGTAGQLPAQKAMKQFSKQPAERGEADSGNAQPELQDPKLEDQKDRA